MFEKWKHHKTNETLNAWNGRGTKTRIDGFNF
jgi:hypothetical protein